MSQSSVGVLKLLHLVNTENEALWKWVFTDPSTCIIIKQVVIQ